MCQTGASHFLSARMWPVDFYEPQFTETQSWKAVSSVKVLLFPEEISSGRPVGFGQVEELSCCFRYSTRA